MLYSIIATWLIITSSIARSVKCRHLSYSEGDFEVILPMGDTLHQWGWHLAWRSGSKVHSRPNFTPSGAMIKVWDPKNWKI